MNVAVVGLGRLGLPLATLLAESGHLVFGCDISPDTIRTLRERGCPTTEPGVSEMLDANRGRMVWSSDPADAAQADISFVVVPTPSDRSGRFDSSAVVSAVTSIGEGLRSHTRRHVVVVVSTLMPGDSDSTVREALEAASGRSAGYDTLGLVYSPQFIALGSVLSDMRRPDMLLIGATDEQSGKETEAVLSGIDSGRRRVDSGADLPEIPGGLVKSMTGGSPVTHHLSLTEAEIVKLAVNSFVTMKLSYANTLGEVCDGWRANKHLVARAVGTDRRVGSAYLRPGGPYGGPCFPRDSLAFQIAADDVGAAAPLAAATDTVNYSVGRLAVDRVLALRPDKVAVLGVAYKPGTDVTERSFGSTLAIALAAEGVRVETFDPLAPCTAPTLADALSDADVVIVATDDEAWADLETDAVVWTPW